MKRFEETSMTHYFSRVLSACALAALSMFATVTPAQTPRKPEWATPVDASANLFRITPGFFRSAQLTKNDVTTIQALGVKTVVSLRKFHRDDTLLKGSGVNVKRIGINTWNVGDRHVIATLKVIRAAEKEGPVLLHCQHGADRTGLVTAMYRIVFQGWSKDAALEELTQGDYGYHSIWKNIPAYPRSADIEKIRRAVEAS
jgi:protein tyrosine/serine phosphatase